VNCEGYSGPKDRNVLKGSCSLEYFLERSAPGYSKKQNREPHDTVSKSSLSELVFYKGQTAKARYSTPKPQLLCVGGSAGCASHLEPKFIRCTRPFGGYHSNADWNCNATLPSGYRIGNTSVICEGAGYAEDENVLQGSCRLEYTIETDSLLNSLLHRAGLDGAWSSMSKMLLEDVPSLTFRAGEMTAARRSSPISKLRCVAGCTATNQPSQVTCTNRGSAGNGNIQWECKGDVGKGYHFGRVNVNCEGYANREDRYVLENSCGLEYSLERDQPSFW